MDLKNNNLCDEGVSSHAFSGLRGYVDDVFSLKLHMEYLYNSYLYRLQYLDLSKNKLTKVPVRLPRSLKRLHIEKNELDYIPIDAFERLKVLITILL